MGSSFMGNVVVREAGGGGGIWGQGWQEGSNGRYSYGEVWWWLEKVE